MRVCDHTRPEHYTMETLAGELWFRLWAEGMIRALVCLLATLLIYICQEFGVLFCLYNKALRLCCVCQVAGSNILGSGLKPCL